MARKPNYKFERLERQRAKDAKKAERAEAKEKRKTEDVDLVQAGGDVDGSPEEPAGQPRKDGNPE